MIKVIDIGDYHLRFNTENGFMARWGKTKDEDPVMCPVGPEIADIEISTICNGIGKSIATRKPCVFCYKSNTGCGENMSLETFKTVLEKFPKTLTQVALGIGDIDSNPDLIKILDYCNSVGVIPNLTVNGMAITETWAKTFAGRCGAVAVSSYHIDDVCFDAVEKLTRNGLRQCNIHKLVAHETLGSCHDLIRKASTDPRLKNLKAIVFLIMKPKGDRNKLTPVRSLDDFKTLFDSAEKHGIAIGMDSCSAPMALKTLPSSTITSIEPCESSLFSIYVNVKGSAFPCSFSEGTPGWENGVDLMNSELKDFTSDVWYGPLFNGWRKRLLESSSGCSGCSVQKHCRSCPIYNVSVCKRAKHEN